MAARINITTTLVFGKERYFQITVDGKTVQIPVAEAVYIHFTNQFPKKTDNQRKRSKTLRRLVEAAYRYGLSQSHVSSEGDKLV